MKKAKVFNVWSKIRSALRKVWMYSPQRRQALSDVKMADGMYVCLLCKKPQEKYAMEVDHITECGSLKSLPDIQGFVDRLFNGKLQAICKPCHKAKRSVRSKGD